MVINNSSKGGIKNWKLLQQSRKNLYVNIKLPTQMKIMNALQNYLKDYINIDSSFHRLKIYSLKFYYTQL